MVRWILSVLISIRLQENECLFKKLSSQQEKSGNSRENLIRMALAFVAIWLGISPAFVAAPRYRNALPLLSSQYICAANPSCRRWLAASRASAAASHPTPARWRLRPCPASAADSFALGGSPSNLRALAGRFDRPALCLHGG